MVPAPLDWTTVASLATAGGTLVLAVATFASVRSANFAARTAERAVQVQLRPLLFPSRLEDRVQKIRWGDDHWASLPGGRSVVEEADGAVYLAISLRNVGSGIAVLHGWRTAVGELMGGPPMQRPALESLRPQSRDLYVGPGDVAFWQAAIRDADDPDGEAVRAAIAERHHLLVDVLYSDHDGHQRVISRFTLSPPPDARTDWLCSVVRHWHLDRPDPRR